MLGNLIGGFIVILVGLTLAPTVAQNVGTAQADGNITGASDTIIGLTTLFYCLAIASTIDSVALSIPLLRLIGFAPAVTFLRPSR